MDKIESFKVNHLLLDKGIYISRRDKNVTTVDMRMRKPYADALIDNAALHSFEHCFATVLRNGRHAENVVYAGPMGCQTGFYCLFQDMTDGQIFDEIKGTVKWLCENPAVMPGASKTECGNCLNLSAEKSQALAKSYYDVINDKTAFDVYK